MFNKIKFVLILILPILFINHAFASGEVIINEIMYDLEGSDDNYEWVELKNISGTIVDLTGWKFNDGSNHNLNVPPKNGGQGSLVLSPNNFMVLADNAVAFLTNHPNFSGIVIDTTMSLNNTSDILKIIDSSGIIIDQVEYFKDWGANGNGYSLERVSDLSGQFCQSRNLGGSANEVNNADCSVVVSSTTTPTLSASASATATISSNPDLLAAVSTPVLTTTTTPIATIIPTVAKLTINEFIPNPEGSDEENEWIEIYNYGDFDVSLTRWKLEDASGAKYIFDAEEIKTGEYLQILRSKFKFSINNDAETLSLISPDGKVASKISYSGGSKQGFSFARFGVNDWRWTNILTPNAKNEFSQAEVSVGPSNSAEVSSDTKVVQNSNAEETQNSSNSFRNVILLVFGVGIVFSIGALVFIKKVDSGK